MLATPESISREVSTRSIIWSVLLIVFGFLALAAPMASSFGVAITIAWLVFFGGLVELVHAFQSKGIGHILWKVLVAIFYIVAGIYLIANPALSLAGMTLALAIFFVAEGFVEVITYFSTRRSGSSGWILVNGIVTLALGLFIWSRWPATSLWLLGTVVGISLLMAGTTRLMMALAVRKLLRSHVDPTIHERRAA